MQTDKDLMLILDVSLRKPIMKIITSTTKNFLACDSQFVCIKALLLETILSLIKYPNVLQEHLHLYYSALIYLACNASSLASYFADKKSKGCFCGVLLLLSVQLYIYIFWLWSLENRHQKVSFFFSYSMLMIFTLPWQVPPHPDTLGEKYKDGGGMECAWSPGELFFPILFDFVQLKFNSRSFPCREIDEALRPGVYSLIDICSKADFQRLHTSLGG